jgi:hypothetical protein
MAFQNSAVCMSFHSRSNTVNGDGRMYCDFQPLMTRSCQPPTTMPMARSLGHSEAHTRDGNDGGRSVTVSRASSPASSCS